MWSRERINDLKAFVDTHGHAEGFDCSVPGIDHVYFGHTILRAPVTVGNCSWIDTGAYKTDNLTVAVVSDRMESRSEEHTSELQSLMRISYAVFCLKKKNKI